MIRAIGRGGLAVALLPWLAAALLLSACTAPTGPVTLPNPADDAVLYVIERSWHSDIGLPAAALTGPLAEVAQRLPGVQALTFGFGERQFLMAREATLGSMLRALLPSRSALLMTALSTTPEAAFGADHVVVLHLTREGFARVEAAVWRQIEQSPPGEPVVLGDGPYPGSVFFAARGTYDAFDTCNTWTAGMLHTGGLPVPDTGVLFVGQVMGVARSISARQASMRHG